MVKEKAKTAQVIVGNRNMSNIRGAETAKTIFVSNVERNWSEMDITNEMKSHNVTPIFVKCVSHNDAYTKSFKVVIKEQDSAEVMCAEFWPERVRCREWVRLDNI